MHLPICIDLDGTLISEDITSSLYQAYFRTNPYHAMRLLPLLLQRRAHFKANLIFKTRTKLKEHSLNWNMSLIQHLIALQHTELYLATGAHDRVAQEVMHMAQKQGLFFKGAFGTRRGINLVGQNKALFLKQRFPNGFIYYGNSMQDIAVFKKAHHIGIVNPVSRLKTFIKHNQHKIIYTQASF